MCGIAGIVHLDRKGIDIDLLIRMTELVSYRGPDDMGMVLINPFTTDSSLQSIEFMGQSRAPGPRGGEQKSLRCNREGWDGELGSPGA